mgnify:FL=1
MRISIFLLVLILQSFLGFSQDSTPVTPEQQLELRKVTEQNIVLLKNEGDVVPIQNLDKTKIAFVSTLPSDNPMGKMLDNYAKISHYGPSDIKDPTFPKALASFDEVIFAFQSGKDDTLLPSLLQLNNLIIVYFDGPGSNSLKTLTAAKSIIYAPDSKVLSQEYAAQLIFGGFAARGELDLDIPIGFKKGDGLKTLNQIRFKYTIPEEVGLDSKYIDTKVDSIMTYAIQNHSFPGATLLVAKDNKVIFNKAYGYLTYDSVIPVKSDVL